MKDAFDGVSAEAAIIRSPSFSREGESSTITNSSLAVSEEDERLAFFFERGGGAGLRHGGVEGRGMERETYRKLE